MLSCYDHLLLLNEAKCNQLRKHQSSIFVLKNYLDFIRSSSFAKKKKKKKKFFIFVANSFLFSKLLFQLEPFVSKSQAGDESCHNLTLSSMKLIQPLYFIVDLIRLSICLAIC
jgi:hypothetical protein